MTLGPVVSCSRLTENKVIGAEYLSVGSWADRVHGTGFQIDENGSGNVFASGGLVVVHVDPLQLEIAVAMVGASGVDTVLIGDDFPELQETRNRLFHAWIIYCFVDYKGRRLSGCIKFACYDYTITCFQKTIHGALLELREELCFWTQYLLASRKRTILMKRYLDSQANQSLALIVLIAIFQIPVAQNNKAATAIMTRKTFCLQLGYLAPPMLQTWTNDSDDFQIYCCCNYHHWKCTITAKPFVCYK